MAEKVDHLRLCNAQNEPFHEFEARFCVRCFQSECSRSQHGKTAFEARIGSWEKRLFTDVPRLNAEDDRYSKVAAQKFLAVGVGPARAAPTWLDPSELAAQVEKEAPRAPSEPAPLPVPVAQPVAQQPEMAATPPVQRQAANTPNRPRQMLGGAAPPPPAPVLDPWQPTQPIKPGETLIEKGAKVRFK